MAARKHRVAGSIWGNGFAEDGWSEAAAVRSWDRCGPDEYIRLFPGLVSLAAPLPDCLRKHLTDCVAAQAWRLYGSQSRMGEPLRSVDAVVIEDRGQRAATEWFAAEGWASWIWANHRAQTIARRSRELSALRFVDGLVCDIIAGRPAPFNPATSARFAFHAGLHPLYVWPEASSTHERDTAAGWLGHLSRRRRAFMPVEVAHHLVDAVATSIDGTNFFRDPDLAPLSADLGDIASIGLAARARLQGVQAPVEVVAAGRRRTARPVKRRRAMPGEVVVQ